MSVFERELKILEGPDLLRITGQVRRVSGLVAEADGMSLPLGSSCRIQCRADSGREIEAEVVGFRDDRVLLVPYGRLQGISPGDLVHFEGESFLVSVSRALVGRVVNASGEPIDDKGPVSRDARIPIDGMPVAPLARQRIAEPLSTGVRAIDAMLTLGRGQRVGIFAGSGVGKSVLLGMLARFSAAPLTVIALIGERGREVREFIEKDLGPEGLARSIVVVATADEAPVVRIRAARTATAIAEWFRDAGQDVVLLFDSITRVAMAQREVGISASEPPTTKAYPPSVFTLLTQLLERTGPGERGSITGIYSVLVEADDMNDPVSDSVRGVLDGHIWLSRRLANRGHFPAIDVLESVSRVMPSVVTPEQIETSRRVVADLARHRDAEDLIQLGAYVRGTDPLTDGAIDRMPAIDQLLRQTSDEASTHERALAAMRAIYEAKPGSVPGAKVGAGIGGGLGNTALNGGIRAGTTGARKTPDMVAATRGGER